MNNNISNNIRIGNFTSAQCEKLIFPVLNPKEKWPKLSYAGSCVAVFFRRLYYSITKCRVINDNRIFIDLKNSVSAIQGGNEPNSSKMEKLQKCKIVCQKLAASNLPGARAYDAGLEQAMKEKEQKEHEAQPPTPPLRPSSSSLTSEEVQQKEALENVKEPLIARNQNLAPLKAGTMRALTEHPGRTRIVYCIEEVQAGLQKLDEAPIDPNQQERDKLRAKIIEMEKDINNWIKNGENPMSDKVLDARDDIGKLEMGLADLPPPPQTDSSIVEAQKKKLIDELEQLQLALKVFPTEEELKEILSAVEENEQSESLPQKYAISTAPGVYILKGEDAAFTLETSEILALAVFDGHGNNLASQYAAQQVKARLEQSIRDAGGDIVRGMNTLIEAIHKEIDAKIEQGRQRSKELQKQGIDPKTADEEWKKWLLTGAVFSISIKDLRTNLLYTFTLGDCESTLYREINGRLTSIPLSPLGNWTNFNEMVRIVTASPMIAYNLVEGRVDMDQDEKDFYFAAADAGSNSKTSEESAKTIGGKEKRLAILRKMHSKFFKNLKTPVISAVQEGGPYAGRPYQIQNGKALADHDCNRIYTTAEDYVQCVIQEMDITIIKTQAKDKLTVGSDGVRGWGHDEQQMVDAVASAEETPDAVGAAVLKQAKQTDDCTVVAAVF